MKKTILIAISIILILTAFSGIPARTSAQSESLDYKSYIPLVRRNKDAFSSFGVEVHDMDAASLSALQPTVNTFVRYNKYYHGLKWSEYQPNNSSEFIRNAALENDLRFASQNGQRVILNIHGTPAWAQKYPATPTSLGVACGPILESQFGAFANFLKQVVNLYSKAPFYVTYFEIWNEPDGPVPIRPTDPEVADSIYGCWGDSTLPYFGGSYFGDMLKVIYPAMKAANPTVQVVLGGLLLDCDPREPVKNESNPTAPYACANESLKVMSTFFEGILQSGALGSFDWLNFHTYSRYGRDTSPIVRETLPANWKVAGGQVEGKLSYLRELLTRYGQPNKPIMISEAAFNCNIDSCTPSDYETFEQDKAEYVVWLYTRNRAKNVLLTTWYTLDHNGWEERRSGLMDEDNEPLPAYDAYKLLGEKIGEARYVGELNPFSGVRIYEFKSDHTIWVAFSLDGSAYEVPLPVDGTKSASDMYGHQVTITPAGTFTVGRPVYIDFWP